MAADQKRIYHFNDVSKHNLTSDCWLIIYGKVYDVTPFMEDHPGGDEVLLEATGKDATNYFEDVGHSTSAMEMMEEYYVGEIDASSVPTKRDYHFHEVSKHNLAKDCWIIISGKVYDITPFIEDHPGGDEVLLAATGKDATDDFEDVGHSTSAREMMEKYYIGEIDVSNVPTKRNYHFDEVSKHNLADDCWLVISGKVYDVTPFIEDHPGGEEVLLAATVDQKDKKLIYGMVGNSFHESLHP